MSLSAPHDRPPPAAPDATAPFDRRALRTALGQFATGVAIVTARDHAGAPIGMTINSFSSLSLDPALVLWSVQCDASGAQAYRSAPHFAIHVLQADQELLARRFAEPSADRFAGQPVAEGLGGVPLLPGCLACFQCRLWAVHPGGDHDLIIGAVTQFSIGEGSALGFHRGRFITLD